MRKKASAPSETLGGTSSELGENEPQLCALPQECKDHSALGRDLAINSTDNVR